MSGITRLAWAYAVCATTTIHTSVIDVVGRALFPVVVAVKILLFYVFFPRYENSG